MKKTRLFMLFIASLFTLAISAQGIVVHQGNSKQVSFKSKDVQKIEFTENQVENTTDNYVEKSELDGLLDELRDEINKKLDASEAEELWAKIKSILESIRELQENKADKKEVEYAREQSQMNYDYLYKDITNLYDYYNQLKDITDYAIPQVKKDCDSLIQKNGKEIEKNHADISSLGKDVDNNRSDIRGAYQEIEKLTNLVKELQEKIDAGGCSCGGSGETNMNNGHEYVDLGLSVKWATMNVGATEVAGSKTNSHTGQLDCYGEYYAWGETSPKDSYSWSTYTLCNGSYTTMTKYCTDSSYGTVDNKTTLELSDDAAHTNWGGSWRMPTDAELEELMNDCTWTWTTLNGVNGYKVTGTNGNSIFLPAAGYRLNSGIDGIGEYSAYWDSSLYESYSPDAQGVYASSGDVGSHIHYRYAGFSVRPVCP